MLNDYGVTDEYVHIALRFAAGLSQTASCQA